MTRLPDLNTALRAGLLVVASITGGCGGGSTPAASAAPPPAPAPAEITGIAAPPQISVVTAKNAT